jgi:DNA-binding NarL/FixJ family response regulator
VVALVADGLSNADIAETLYISKRTVESHVVHIKHKLGVESRQQMMAGAWRWRVAAADRGAAMPTGIRVCDPCAHGCAA